MGSFGTVSSLCIYDDFSRDGALEKYDAVWSEIKTILEQHKETINVTSEDGVTKFVFTLTLA